MRKNIVTLLSALAAALIALAAIVGCSATITAEKIDANASISNPLEL